jgi:hypothetical protein
VFIITSVSGKLCTFHRYEPDCLGGMAAYSSRESQVEFTTSTDMALEVSGTHVAICP